ncbi:MAG: signal peptidase I, partial [Deltaproteobacteria bacterium]|nr:signal peptidase I [Deltaproteobacteria bacterium]
MDELVKKKKGKFRESFEAILVAVIAALAIRAFVLEAFKIPSGSMIPTLSVGDHIFVNKFLYGVRLPFTNVKLIPVTEPKRGDVIVFIPPGGSDHFIKRVIGVGGDRIRIEGEDVSVNGEPLPHLSLQPQEDPGDRRRLVIENGTIRHVPFVPGWRDFVFFEEQQGEKHYVVQYEAYRTRETYEAVVPPGHLFMMGDNRDNSRDSREWGFVPLERVRGKAMFIWL